MNSSIYIKFFLLAASLLASAILGMEKDISKQAVYCPPLSSTAIKIIPQYVYENCNQAVRHTWSHEEFMRLKERAESITVEDVRNETTDENSFTKRCELYDWIHALNFIEKKLLQDRSKGISVENIKKINGCLTRLLVGKHGEYRTDMIVWPKEVVTDTEKYFYEYLANFKESIRAGTNALKGDASGNLTVASVKRVLLHAAKNGEKIKTDVGIQLLAIDPDKADEWHLKYPGTVPGTISYFNWMLGFYHMFPRPEEIAPIVKMWSDWSNEQHHPFIAATRLWYKMIEIHPMPEANKRTGKAVGIVLFLKNGYYPPLIEGEDGKRLVETIFKSFEDDEGYEGFTDFINPLMKKTYKLFCTCCSVCLKKNKLNTCSRCKKVFYCSQEHQREDWPQHKKDCA